MMTNKSRNTSTTGIQRERKYPFQWLRILLVVGLAWNVSQRWEKTEGMLLNIFLPIIAASMPNIDSLARKSGKDQVYALSKVTRKLELVQRLPHFLTTVLFGQEMATASEKTKAIELSVQSRDVGRSIPVLCATPKSIKGNNPLPLVLYFHHGGLVLGTPKQEVILIQYISFAISAVVCSVDYRLAPEHPYPAAINDALDTAHFFLHNDGNSTIEELGVQIDSSKVATFGSSAGGYLAAQVPRLLAHEGISIQAQISLIPMVKPHGGTDSLLLNSRAGDWNRDWNTYAWTKYLSGDDGTLANDWKVSLLVDPPKETLDRLPPAYIQISRNDVLYDEGRLYAQRLKDLDKLIELAEYNAVHVSMIPPLSRGGPAEGAFEQAVGALKQELKI